MPSRYTSTGRVVALTPEPAAPVGVDWLALLAAKAVYAWDGTSGLSLDRLTWTDLVAGRVVTSTSAPGAATLNGHAAVSITNANQGYRRTDGDVTITNPFTILAVFDSTDDTTASQYAFHAAAGTYIAGHTGTSLDAKWFDNSWRGSAAPTLGAQVLRWTQTGGTTECYRNGVLITSAVGLQRNIGGNIGIWSDAVSAARAARGIAAHLSLYSSAANAIEVEAAAIARFL